ncbi:MAG: helix-turn-helix domain-containing protein [Muribaculaceae bacterium]|nr:helix-turn-helix domain-containing protein [Muribaculaceae bacterium]
MKHAFRHCAYKIFLALLLSILPASALAEYFRHLTLGEGLSQPSVMAISQDRIGRIWLGTREGVNVYDGKNISVFKGWVDNLPGQNRVWIGNEVSAIVTDSVGDIYLLIDNNIVKYHLCKGHFNRLTSDGNVSAIAENNGEIVYIAGDSILTLSPDNSRKLNFRVPAVKNIVHLTADSAKFYISTTAGLYIFNRNNRSHRLLLPDDNIYSTFISADSGLWISTHDSGLLMMEPDGPTPRVVSMPSAPEGVLGARQCRHAIEDDFGRIWYGSFSGLFRYDPATGTTSHIKIPANIGGLTHTSVFGIYRDRKGNLWVGTYYGGVNYFSPEDDKFINFNYDGYAPYNLSHSFVKDLVTDRDGNLWFATDGAGVSCVDKNWNIKTHLSTHTHSTPLRQNNVRSLAYHPESNRLFIGTHLGGLSILDIDVGKVTNLIDNPAVRNLIGDVIHDMKIFDNYLFLSTKKGVFRMNLRSSDIEKVNTGIRTQQFDIDRKGNIFCASLATHDIYIIENICSDNPVTSVFAACDNTVYPTNVCCTDSALIMGTLGSGLMIYPYNGDAPVNLNSENSKLPDNYCYAAVQGKDNMVFVTSEKHVVKLNTATREIESVAFADFFPESHIINECALMFQPDGDLLIGSTKGITRINGKEFKKRNEGGESSGIYFSTLTVQNNEVTAADPDGILETALPFAHRISLPSNRNSFKIRLGISDYTTSTATSAIEYRLDGLDTHWLTAGNNELRYNDLPPGTYKLRARQAGTDREIALDIHVRSPWYNSWWAWMVYILAALAIGAYIVHKSLDAAKLRLSLKKEQNERAQIEKVNQEKFVFFTNVSHEFQTPLTLIISHIDILLAKYKRHAKLSEALMRVRAHSEQMSHLITQLLEFRKLQQNRQVLRIGYHDANETLRETATPFVDYATKRGIDFTIDTPDPAPVGVYDPALINRVLVNILSNAFKYTPDGGVISCSAASDADGNIVFEVTDNGRGIAEKDLPYIFDRFYNGTADELKRHNVDYRSTGIGLAFAKSITDKHHGAILVKSREGEGTTFRVVLPGNKDIFEGDSNVIFEAVPSIRPVEEPSSVETRQYEPEDNGSDTSEDNNETVADKPLLLVVEDNAELRANLSDFFSAYFRVETAEDGEAGLAKIRELSPDIVVSDVMMPRMSGTEMCRIVKADLDLCHIPVILLTALSTTESKLEGLNTNADDYVTKPFESTLLLARIDNLLRMRRILRSQFEKQPVSEVDMTIVNPLDRDLLKRATAVIEEHIDDMEFDIPLLCREVGVSRSLFFNKFKSLTGMTPNAFILNYRLKHAATLLTAQPHLSIAEIADRSGFATAIYFSRCFRKQFGVSPANYRKGDTAPDATDDC